MGGFDFLFPTKSTAEIGDESFDLSEDVNNLQISIVFGLGYRVPLKRSKLYFELRYEQGLVNITDVPNPVTSYIPRVKPVAIQLLVGWQIPFKKSK